MSSYRSSHYALALVMAVGCSQPAVKTDAESMRIGAILPFTGREAALGYNIEQALILAVEDVNRAGGIDGTPLRLVTRDSHSGSDRGMDELLTLLYDEDINFLVGPEEDELATDIVPDVKARDVLNVLPGFAAPGVKRPTTTGAWLRLAPSAYATACAFSGHAALTDQVHSANALTTGEDFNALLSSVFTSQMREFTGITQPSVVIPSDRDSYASEIERVFSHKADKTLLIAPPATAANIISEWVVMDQRGSWYLSPLLRSEVFLLNVPYRSLEGAFGVSPTLSLESECDTIEAEGSQVQLPINCVRENANQFRAHFAARWYGTQPFAASHFYYDAIVLLAMGMHHAMATTGELPNAKTLQRNIRTMNQSSREPGYWHDLPNAWSALRAGRGTRYVGAAAEYTFDDYGAATQAVFDTWIIHEHAFQVTGNYLAECTLPY